MSFGLSHAASGEIAEAESLLAKNVLGKGADHVMPLADRAMGRMKHEDGATELALQRNPTTGAGVCWGNETNTRRGR